MKGRSELNAGDHSTNVQNSEDVKIEQVNNYGVSYSEVKEIAMDVFSNNFYKLGEEAGNIAKIRAEEFIEDYLKKLNFHDPDAIKNTNDPDLQYVIYNAQKEHARLGNQDISDLLVEALISRTKENELPLNKIILNEALEMIPKITLKQINALSFIFLMKYVNKAVVTNIQGFGEILNIFHMNTPNDHFSYRHLEYAGCLSISIGEIPFEKLILNHYKENFSNPDNITIFESELSTFNSKYPTIMNNWNTSSLKNCSLSTVGLAIGLINFNRRLGFKWDLKLFIND